MFEVGSDGVKSRARRLIFISERRRGRRVERMRGVEEAMGGGKQVWRRRDCSGKRGKKRGVEEEGKRPECDGDTKKQVEEMGWKEQEGQRCSVVNFSPVPLIG